MDPITTVMRQCRLFDGIPEEKYQMYWPAFWENPNRFVRMPSSSRSASARSGPAL